jgi:hypothetical protein
VDPDDSICLHCLGCNSIFFIEMLNPPEDDDTPNPMFCPFCGRDHQTLEEEFDRMLVESLRPNLVLIPGGKK